MRNVKKLLAIGLSVAMVLGMAACGNDKPANTSESAKESQTTSESTAKTETSEVKDEAKEPITLEWWYRGNGMQKDTELVEEEFNKLLQTFPGMEHVTVNLNCYTGSDYANAVTLAQSADQQMDILNTVYLNFEEQVEMGTFISLNDLLKDNQALYNELPEWLWELGAIDGEIYMVPHQQRAANQEYFVTPKEYMDKYGDEEAIRAVLSNEDRTIEEVAAMLETYCAAVQAGEGKTKYMYALGQSYTHEHGFTERCDILNSNFVLMEGSDTVEYYNLTEDAVKAYEISADWYDKGYIHPDRLTITESEMYGKNMLNPVSYVFTMQNSAGDEATVSAQFSAQYGFDVYAIPIWSDYFIENTWGAGGDGVTTSCENPVEALRLIELMNTEEGIELYNMVVYGLEGTHWEWVDKANNKIKTLEYNGTQGGVDASYAAMKWIMGNTFHAYQNQGCVDGEIDIAKEINTSDKNGKSKIMGMRVKVDSVQTQIEQIKAVSEEYKSIKYGVMGVDGWKALYDEYVTKLEAAGIKDVLTELQSQVDAYLAK